MKTSKKPGLWIVVALNAWYFAAILVAIVSLLVVNEGDNELAMTPMWTIGTGIFIAIASGSAAYGAAKLSGSARIALRAHAIRGWIPLGAALVGAIAAKRNFAPLTVDPMEPFDSFSRMLSDARSVEFIAVLLCTAVLSNAGGELLFRGFVQKRLEQRFGPWVAVACVTALSALWALDVREGISTASIAFFAGMAVIATGSVWSAVLVTVCADLASMIAVRAGHPFEQTRPSAILSVVILSAGYSVVRAARIAVKAERATHPKTTFSQG